LPQPWNSCLRDMSMSIGDELDTGTCVGDQFQALLGAP
jgi:hypothetical protein